MGLGLQPSQRARDAIGWVRCGRGGSGWGGGRQRGAAEKVCRRCSTRVQPYNRPSIRRAEEPRRFWAAHAPRSPSARVLRMLGAKLCRPRRQDEVRLGRACHLRRGMALGARPLSWTAFGCIVHHRPWCRLKSSKPPPPGGARLIKAVHWACGSWAGARGAGCTKAVRSSVGALPQRRFAGC